VTFLRRGFGATLVLLAALMTIGPTTGALAQTNSTEESSVTVIQMVGLLDPILADFVIDAINRADADPRSRAVVLQVNSTGSVVDQEKLIGVAEAIADANLPVTAWVGGSGGARATNEVAQLLGLVDRVAVAPGARLGELGEPALGQRFPNPWGDLSDRLTNQTVNHDESLEVGISMNSAPVVGEFIVQLSDQFDVPVTLNENGGSQLESFVRFERLSVLKRWMHSVASPPVAYLLFVIGMALLLFEFYTAGVGLAGMIGAGCFLLGAYGLGVLPTRTWAIVLLVLSMLAFGVDVQTGVPRFWTVAGSILFIVGTFGLYTGGVSLSWIAILVGIVGILTAVITGMPTMVRTRFSTPTIGREWMVGEFGHAVEAVSPDGVVRVKDALWKARTNRATPIGVGDVVRVAGIDGLWLEVEPEDGAARDYRERG